MNRKTIFELRKNVSVQPQSQQKLCRREFLGQMAFIKGKSASAFFRGRSVTAVKWEEIAAFNMQVLPQYMEKCVIGTTFKKKKKKESLDVPSPTSHP